MERERLTHEKMKNHLLSGDKIDSTTNALQEDFEIDRQVGNSTDSLIQLPTEKHKI